MLEDERARLAERQASLAAALTCGDHLPPGLDRYGVAATAEVLARKRRRLVTRSWPGVASALGPRFAELFDAYARTQSQPPNIGSLADGREFVRWMARREKLSDALVLQCMAVDLRHRPESDRLAERRGPAVRLAWLDESLRLVLAVRLPLLGERWFELPIGWLTRSRQSFWTGLRSIQSGGISRDRARSSRNSSRDGRTAEAQVKAGERRP